MTGEKPAKKAKTKTSAQAIEDMTPNSKANHENAALKASATNQLQVVSKSSKALADKVRRGMEESAKLAEDLPANGYPKEMGPYYMDLFSPVSSAAGLLLEVWSGVIKADLTLADTEEIDTMALDLMSRQNALEKSFEDLEGEKKQVKGMVPLKNTV